MSEFSRFCLYPFLNKSFIHLVIESNEPLMDKYYSQGSKLTLTNSQNASDFDNVRVRKISTSKRLRVRIIHVSQTKGKNLLVVSPVCQQRKILLAKLCKCTKQLTSSPDSLGTNSLARGKLHVHVRKTSSFHLFLEFYQIKEFSTPPPSPPPCPLLFIGPYLLVICQLFGNS